MKSGKSCGNQRIGCFIAEIATMKLVTIQPWSTILSPSISSRPALFVKFVKSFVPPEMLLNHTPPNSTKLTITFRNYVMNFLSLDYDVIIKSKMGKTELGWQCYECGKVSKVKTNIYEHVESIHTDSPGYMCPLCHKHCKTRNALRAHKFREHNYQSGQEQHEQYYSY